MSNILTFPLRHGYGTIEIVELELNKWVGGIDVLERRGEAPEWATYEEAAAFAAGMASVTGLPVVDWNKPISEWPNRGDAA